MRDSPTRPCLQRPKPSRRRSLAVRITTAAVETPPKSLVLTVLVPTPLLELLKVFLVSLLPRNWQLPSNFSVVKATRPQRLLETQACLRLCSPSPGL